MKLRVDIEKAGSNWAASASDDKILGTVVATGATRSLTIKKFRSALKFHLQGLRKDGQTVPEVTELEVRELIPA
jgi:predicted RNase H-like HicB family nuclease